MIINFALSLSPDGIELLHRVQRGWRRMGKSDVASDTLDDDLAKMREKALAIAGGQLHTKLIIPLDQIKYTAIDSTMTTLDDIHAELDGATPYALDDLVIDCERFGGRTHIAAVARDTLREAESFARAHQFNPIAFVAVPEPFTFQSEVFFGPTEMMPEILGADATVVRDALPVMIVGTRLKSRLLVFDLPEGVEEAIAEENLADVLPPLIGQSDVASPEPVEAPPEQVPDRIVAPPAQDIWIDLVIAEYHAPKTPQIDADIKDPEIAAPSVRIVPEHPVLASVPLFDAIIPEVHPSASKPAKPILVAVAGAGSVKAPKLGAAVPAASTPPAPQSFAKQYKTPLIAASAVLAAAFAGLIWTQARFDDLEEISTAQAMPPVAAIQAPSDETAPTAGPTVAQINLTGFGAASTNGDALAVLTLSTPFQSGPAPDLISATAADAPPAAIPVPPAPPAQQTAQATVGAPILRGQVLSPADAVRIYAATGVWQRATRFFDVPRDGIVTDLIRPVPTTAPPRIAQPNVPDLGNLETDLSFIAPKNPPPPEAVFPRDAAGFILATPEGTVTPDGAVVIAGLPDLNIALRPELTQDDLDRMALLSPAPEGVVLISGRPDIVPPLRPADAALPQTADTEIQTDDAPAPEALTPGSVGLAGLQLQDDGRIGRATPIVGDPALAGLRPQLRPGALAAIEDPGTPDITSIIADIEREDAALRFDSSTALAVASSVRPDKRPSNFGAVVAAATARLQQARPAAVAAVPQQAAAPVIPQNTTPLPGGVARAATQEEAIRLRQINLIGVYGRPNSRRALVRLGNGRYVQVEIGSALDGGEVIAIGDNALNYVKRGRTYAIGLP